MLDLVIEHDMALLAKLCDGLIAMERGTVIATGAPREVLDHAAVIASYLGTDPGVIARSGAVSR